MAHPEITFGGDAEFLRAFDSAVVAAGGRRRCSPTTLVGGWREFVRECEDGYLDDIEEFHFDLSVRGLIEKLRRDPELLRFRELDWVWAEISAVDVRYRALLVPKGGTYPQSWWKAGIPRKAGPELAAEFLTLYGVRVEVVDR
ncbi:hypothetical protein [Kribbella italica]|uniref:Uncharacterized protein n=1 Tax=Kribbella italica TaxID=1540520 RepID=A0A7W9MUL2_9ACTN|nr:hypothetical protein [Kribbella italica]MBB5836295.1 hypothetical protein [Kribbella italica]